MKTVYLFALGVLVFLTSCQKEEETIIQDNTQSFEKTSPIAGLLARTSQNPTSIDNVVDNSSCFSIVLPVTVIVNSQEIVVTNQTDYQIVQDAIDEFSNDDDIVNFIYPITIQFQNFQTLVVQNSNQLDDVLDDCGDDDGFDEINCIAIVYPISINVYDSNNQIADTVTITSNSQLFNFLANLSGNTFVAISYPISVTNSNGQTIVINSNAQLEDFIEDSIDDCDDDDNPGNGSNNPEFADVLVSGTWYVSFFQEDNTIQTNDFAGYNFTFSSNGNVTAVKNSTTINGTWQQYLDSGENKFELDFSGVTLDEIEEDWRIIEFSSTVIKLKHVSGGDGSIDYLTFTKN